MARHGKPNPDFWFWVMIGVLIILAIVYAILGSRA